MGVKAAEPPRLLVVCVDRDDDVGVKAGVETPIIGRERCLSAGTRLAVADPEEADANTIFAAVRELDELSKKGYQCEVAVLAGIFERGVEADQKVLSQLKTVLETYKADGMVLVTDGTEDEQVIPILQGVLPIVSVKRVVIKHSRGVEESYAVLGRYLRMLAYDPRYSRFFLGVPGVVLLIIGLLIYFELIRIALAVVLGIIGVVLLIRGFELDRAAGYLTKLRPSGYIRFFSALASLLIVVAAFYQAFTGIATTEQYAKLVQDPMQFFNYGPFLLGLFIQEALNLLWTGLAIFFAGALLYHWLRKSARMVRDAVALLVLTLLYLPVLQFSLILMGVGSPVTLVSFLLIGLAVIFLVVALIYQYIRSRREVE